MIRVFPDAETLSNAVADEFAATAETAIGARGRFVVALAGGSTPRRAYEILAQPHLAHRIDWSKVSVFWGDERCVPPTDPDSNERMAREVLLSKVPVVESQVFPLRSVEGYLEALAAVERFDLVHLGMGGDGHTASLFPGTGNVESTERVLSTMSPAGVQQRVSLGASVLADAELTLFSVAGADKAERVREVLQDEGCSLPAAVVSRTARNPLWFLDAAAAGKLTSVSGAW